MSTTVTTEQTALLCPGCAGPLEATQTICAACRSALEEQVLTVRAADYPGLFHNVVRNSGEPHRSPVDPTSMDMLKVAENTADDLDLVPLVPMDEPRKGGAEPTAATSGSTSSAASSAVEVAIPLAGSQHTTAVAPAARPTQTVYTPPASKLEPSSSYKHVLIAVGGLIAAVALAAVFWSVLVPKSSVETDTSVVAPPSSIRPAGK